MSEERYDLVIFGATGFTGQFVVEEVARIQDEIGGLTMAIAGRNMGKLQKILEQASKQTGNMKSDKIYDVFSQRIFGSSVGRVSAQ